MQNAFPLVLLAVCGLFFGVILIHNTVIRPIRRSVARRRSNREYAEMKLSLR